MKLLLNNQQIKTYPASKKTSRGEAPQNPRAGTAPSWDSTEAGCACCLRGGLCSLPPDPAVIKGNALGRPQESPLNQNNHYPVLLSRLHLQMFARREEEHGDDFQPSPGLNKQHSDSEFSVSFSVLPSYLANRADFFWYYEWLPILTEKEMCHMSWFSLMVPFS